MSNRIKTLISQALIDLETSQEEVTILITILNEKEKHEKMKEGIRSMKSCDELNKEEGEKKKQKQNYNNNEMHENKRNAWS